MTTTVTAQIKSRRTADQTGEQKREPLLKEESQRETEILRAILLFGQCRSVKDDAVSMMMLPMMMVVVVVVINKEGIVIYCVEEGMTHIGDSGGYLG